MLLEALYFLRLFRLSESESWALLCSLLLLLKDEHLGASQLALWLAGACRSARLRGGKGALTLLVVEKAHISWLEGALNRLLDLLLLDKHLLKVGLKPSKSLLAQASEALLCVPHSLKNLHDLLDFILQSGDLTLGLPLSNAQVDVDPVVNLNHLVVRLLVLLGAAPCSDFLPVEVVLHGQDVVSQEQVLEAAKVHLLLSQIIAATWRVSVAAAAGGVVVDLALVVHCCCSTLVGDLLNFGVEVSLTVRVHLVDSNAVHVDCSSW